METTQTTLKPAIGVSVLGKFEGQIKAGRVTCWRRNGFYVRFKSRWPMIPGGSKPRYISLFFTHFDADSWKASN